MNHFSAHYNEAFSSLRIENYKHIVRMHITPAGDLELFVLGVDRVPRKWRRDPQWSGSRRRRFLRPDDAPSYEWDTPSRWRPVPGEPDTVQLVDHVVVRKSPARSRRRYSF